MSSAKITLLGFYNWMNDAGEDLFAAFDDLPAGVDKDDLVANILLRGGEFEVLYSDPVFMQAAIGPWLRKWQRTIEKWVTALSIKYDPLYNYDRTEEWTETGTTGRNLTENIDRTNNEDSSRQSQTTTGTVNNTSETHSGNVTTTNSVSAFDSGTYSPKEETVAADGVGITTDSNGNVSTGSHDQGNVYSRGNETRKEGEDESRSNVHKGHLYGNIGVVSSQEMLTQEIEVARFNLIDEITDLFLPEFIIPVYY